MKNIAVAGVRVLPSEGSLPSMGRLLAPWHSGKAEPPVDRMTDTCENITILQLHLREVQILENPGNILVVCQSWKVVTLLFQEANTMCCRTESSLECYCLINTLRRTGASLRSIIFPSDYRATLLHLEDCREYPRFFLYKLPDSHGRPKLLNVNNMAFQ